MTDQHDEVAAHYGAEDLVDRVHAALREARGSLENLTVGDLTPIDSFHIRGPAATAELACRVDISPGWRVLDVGSGPGGTARYLAAEHGCRVTGLDITPEYVSLAESLSQMVGLTETTSFHCGNALAMPFPDEEFDCVWAEQVQMNIADKSRFFSEMYRVLRRGSQLVMLEVFQGARECIHLPVPWSEKPSTNFLVTAAEMQQIVQDQGFEIVEWADVTAVSMEWFRSVRQKIAETGTPSVGAHLLMGPSAPEKGFNLRLNLEEGRVTVEQAVLERPR